MDKQKTIPSINRIKAGIQSMKDDTQFANDRLRWAGNVKGFVLVIFRLAIILGICYVILGPVIGIISSSFFSDMGISFFPKAGCKVYFTIIV